MDKELYKGILNWKGEIHELWTHADSYAESERIFITKLSEKIGMSRWYVSSHFDGRGNNLSISREIKEVKQ